MSKYTPTTDEVKEWYADSIDRIGGEGEFDRWLSQHEQQLREQIAREIKAAPSWIPMDSDDVGYLHGLSVAERIAREGADND